MIVLDTNVISELMRGPEANRNVLTWVRAERAPLATTVFTRSEILAGIAILPQGARRDALAQGAMEILSGFKVCLPHTEQCSAAYAEIVATRRRQGRPIAVFDALIASLIQTTGAALATRDVDGFTGLGLTLLNPWEAITVPPP